jgi:hypothetical protein
MDLKSETTYIYGRKKYERRYGTQIGVFTRCYFIIHNLANSLFLVHVVSGLVKELSKLISLTSNTNVVFI